MNEMETLIVLIKDREAMKEDKKRLKQQLLDLTTQQQSQLDMLKKQNRHLSKRQEELEHDLQEEVKISEGVYIYIFFKDLVALTCKLKATLDR